MPRPRTFDREQALTKAMEAFRAHGYRATHMRGIAEHIGVSRSSLYASFGDKRSLFVHALRKDARQGRTDGLPDLAKCAAPRQAIVDLFESTTAGGGATPPAITLLIRTAIEIVPDDPDVTAVVQEELTLLEDNIRQGVERGIAAGEISRRVDAAQAACALLSLFLGTHMLMASMPTPRASASQVEALLPPP